MERTYTLRTWHLVLLAMAALTLGFTGALGGKMYTHHNEQHWNLEQAQKKQELINQEFVNAINGLAGQLRK